MLAAHQARKYGDCAYHHACHAENIKQSGSPLENEKNIFLIKQIYTYLIKNSLLELVSESHHPINDECQHQSYSVVYKEYC